MNFENDPRLPGGNFDEPQPRRSSKKGWLVGGCGCLTLLTLCCVGGGAFFWFTYGKPVADFLTENITLVTESEEVKDVLGSPIKTGVPSTSASQKNGSKNLVMSIPMSGPQGSGVLTIEGHEQDGKWVRDELFITVGDKRIDLNPEKEFELDINLGL